MKMKHPIQPLGDDGKGVIRFKPNKIVQHLLDHGGIDMNQLALIDFPQEDREQFAQLIGYSLSGFSELSYVSNDIYSAAEAMSKAKGLSPDAARVKALEETLAEARKAIRNAATAVFRIHPDDLAE